jgi:hypothetical protein
VTTCMHTPASCTSDILCPTNPGIVLTDSYEQTVGSPGTPLNPATGSTTTISSVPARTSTIQVIQNLLHGVADTHYLSTS